MGNPLPRVSVGLVQFGSLCIAGYEGATGLCLTIPNGPSRQFVGKLLTMSNDQNMQHYLSNLSRKIEEIVLSLPEGVDGTVSVRENHVYLDIQGPRPEVFTLVLGSEAPEIVYDSQYIRYELIPEGMEEQIDFAKETVDDITEFLLSDRNPVERKSRILGPTVPVCAFGRRRRVESQKVQLTSPQPRFRAVISAALAEPQPGQFLWSTPKGKTDRSDN